jgi:hypothetical protein
MLHEAGELKSGRIPQALDPAQVFNLSGYGNKKTTPPILTEP